MNEPQWNQEAETFAQVWQRVSPDPDASPIQTVRSPAPRPLCPLATVGPACCGS